MKSTIFLKSFIIILIILTLLFISSLPLPTLLTSPIEKSKTYHTQTTQLEANNLKVPSINLNLLHSILAMDSSATNFYPKNVTNLDDTYHGSNQSCATEWWYFDAILNQQYSFQFSIHIYDIYSTGFATIQCNIYNNTTKIISEKIMHHQSTMTLSQNKPYIAINNNPLMICNQQMTNGHEKYQITYSGAQYSFNLTYIGITSGWKGTTTAGEWAVIHPKAIVNGSITINNTAIPVSGIGYHDHNWNVTFTTGLNYGWLWGKTITNEHSLTWAAIFETWYKKSSLLVINKDNNGYLNIPTEQLDLSVTQLKFINGMIIPYSFSVSVHTYTCDLLLTIDVIDSDFISILGIINYWRFHVHITGSLSIDNQFERINDYNIAEFICFRPY